MLPEAKPIYVSEHNQEGFLMCHLKSPVLYSLSPSARNCRGQLNREQNHWLPQISVSVGTQLTVLL